MAGVGARRGLCSEVFSSELLLESLCLYSWVSPTPRGTCGEGTGPVPAGPGCSSSLALPPLQEKNCSDIKYDLEHDRNVEVSVDKSALALAI